MNNLENECRNVYNNRGFNTAKLPENNEQMVDTITKTMNYFNKNNAGYIRDTLFCDKECQKERKLQSLLNNYEKSKTELNNAPINYEKSKKDYIVYKDGLNTYINDEKEKYRKEVNQTIEKMNKGYNNIYNEVELILNNVKDQEIYNKHMGELLNIYDNKIKHIDEEEKNIESKSNILNRKTFYDNSWINYWNSLTNYLQYMFWIFLIFYSIIVIYYKKYKEPYFKRHILILLIFILLPFMFLIKNYLYIHFNSRL